MAEVVAEVLPEPVPEPAPEPVSITNMSLGIYVDTIVTFRGVTESGEAVTQEITSDCCSGGES